MNCFIVVICFSDIKIVKPQAYQDSTIQIEFHVDTIKEIILKGLKPCFSTSLNDCSQKSNFILILSKIVLSQNLNFKDVFEIANSDVAKKNVFRIIIIRLGPW